MTLGVTTNGNLAKAARNPYNLDVFIRCIEDIDISLDFGDAERQDESRNCEGAFQGVIETLKLCQKYGKMQLLLVLCTNIIAVILTSVL